MADEFVERRKCEAHGEEHLQSCVNAANIEMMRRDCKETITVFEKELERKTPLWTFIPIIGILVSILGIQWAIYKEVGNNTIAIEQRFTEQEKKILLLQERQNRVMEQVYK